MTYGTQTHPADGTAGLVSPPPAVPASWPAARESRGSSAPARMRGQSGDAQGPAPAAKAALDEAGPASRTSTRSPPHNPFAVSDLWFAGQTGVPLDRMNLYGCSLVYGHPQGPTGARLIVEFLRTLRHRGGGVGLFTGWAAGDAAAAPPSTTCGPI